MTALAPLSSAIPIRRRAGAVVAVSERTVSSAADSAPHLRRQHERRDGRLVARRALAEALGTAEPMRIGVLADGAPVWTSDRAGSGPGLFLSITHTSRYAAAVVAPEACGIDVCELLDAPRVHRTAQRVFTLAELELGLMDDPWLATTAWAVTEAACKMARTSLFGPPSERARIRSLDPPQLVSGDYVTVERLNDAVLAVVLSRGAASGSPFAPSTTDHQTPDHQTPDHARPPQAMPRTGSGT